ncbi:transglycosylase domain-containing protein [Oceanobacillus sp. CFH 90083]|uniref:transglycosylase domain-containing protein n=1 Tax=Oceanobacillus sp. CFH 90083 TaxID=2592336 RepID=UPI00128E2093|nr:transglycosylase domain-containing protein [Oceanobacillus sp. CFH 90083]
MKPFKELRLTHKLIGSIILLMITGILAIYLLAYLMGPPSLSNQSPAVFYDREGEIIEDTFGDSYEWVPLENIDPSAIQATMVIEDNRFFDHSGLDFFRIAKSLWNNFVSGSLKEGASTITQQYARNLYLSPEKTWSRKLQEAFYAIRLEMFYSKEEILEGYMNTIYYGHGAHGIEAASNYFFGKSAHQLTLAEASMLAGIPKGPTYYSPLNHLENATDRQQLILTRMLEKEMITETEYTDALNEVLTYEQQAPTEEEASFFKDQALKEAAQILNKDVEEVKLGGYQLHTTLNKDYQQEMEAAAAQVINEASDLETAGISIVPQTGEIAAMIGGTDYQTSSYNRAIHAKRMPGSTFKPILYYAALENGYTASTTLTSEATTFELADGSTYQPSNFNGYYADAPITLAEAIALSDNIYAVKTALYVGGDRFIETAEKFGIKSDLKNVPSLALGTSSVSVIELTSAYARLANSGKSVTPYLIEKITDADGKTLYSHHPQEEEQVLDEKKAFILTQLLTGMFDETLNSYTSVTGASLQNQLSDIYAGKSGTTDFDSWMIGYRPAISTGIWVGYDDHREMTNVAETAFSKEIWANYMEKIDEDGKNVFPMPSGVVGLPIDPVSGLRADTSCEKSRIMFYEKGTEPLGYCHSDEIDHRDDDLEDTGILERWFDLLF